MTSPNLAQLRRRPVDQLYHQFLKSEKIDRALTDRFAGLLIAHGFISPVHDQTSWSRYVETPKMTNGDHKDELFKLVQAMKG